MRKIIHIDCDSFYASVEQRDDPSLRGLPIAVGGDAQRRGVVCTASYEARRYGVHSAMPMRTALRLCPELLVLPVDMARYRSVSEHIRRIFAQYTDLIEPLSLDEAYLDVSDSDHCRGSATLIAQRIRKQVADELKLTVSAGVAPNKMLAKIASDWQKPNGLTVIDPGRVAEFVQRLPVSKIHGVGPVMARKLANQGIELCGDLQKRSLTELVEQFGTMGKQLHDYAFGRDDRPVRPHRRRKSLSVERTYAEDLVSDTALQSALQSMQVQLAERCARLQQPGAVTGQFLKLKVDDFRATTVDRQTDGSVHQDWFVDMLEEARQRLQRPVRLLGLGVRFADKEAPQSQLSLFPAAFSAEALALARVG